MNLIDEQNLSLQQFVESLTLCFLDVDCQKKVTNPVTINFVNLLF
ncbi:hypothetical protein Hanom_Chr11g01035631 [Helianthus anomalus]